MRALFACAAVICIACHPAAAEAKGKRSLARAKAVKPIASDFDLQKVAPPAAEARSAAIAVPRGMNTDARAWTPPAMELKVARGGPVLAIGAMGSRRRGMPKLAHVGIDWDF